MLRRYIYDFKIILIFLFNIITVLHSRLKLGFFSTMKIPVSLNSCWIAKRDFKPLKLKLYISLCIFSIITMCYFGHINHESYKYTCGSDFGYPHLKLKKLDSIPLQPVNNHPYSYIHLAESTCKEITEIYLLTVVKSATKNFQKRHGIRQTWGYDSNSGNRKMIFIMAFSEETQKQVDSEANLYKDIVQENFQDGYWSNTLKMEMAFNWITKFCRNARYVVFVDDDIYVNFPNTLNYLRSVDEKKVENLYSGLVVDEPFPTRDYFNKHYVSRQDYPFDCFPPYIPSGTVFFSKAVIQKLQKAMPYIPRFHEDDVYLAMIAQKVGVTPSKINFLIRLKDRRTDIKFIPCLISDHGYSTIESFQSAYSVTHSKNLTVELIMDVCMQGDTSKDL